MVRPELILGIQEVQFPIYDSLGFYRFADIHCRGVAADAALHGLGNLLRADQLEIPGIDQGHDHLRGCMIGYICSTLSSLGKSNPVSLEIAHCSRSFPERVLSFMG